MHVLVYESKSNPPGQLVQLVALIAQVAHDESQSLQAPKALTYYESLEHVELQTPEAVNLKKSLQLLHLSAELHYWQSSEHGWHHPYLSKYPSGHELRHVGSAALEVALQIATNPSCEH